MTVSDDSSDGKAEERSVIMNSTPRASRLFRNRKAALFRLGLRKVRLLPGRHRQHSTQLQIATEVRSQGRVRLLGKLHTPSLIGKACAPIYLAACLGRLPPNVRLGWQTRSNLDYRSHVVSSSICYLRGHLVDERAPRLMVA